MRAVDAQRAELCGLIVTDALLLVTKADKRPSKSQKCRLVMLVPEKALARGGKRVRAQGWRRCLTQFRNID